MQQKAWTDSLILAGVLEAWQLAKKQSDLPPFELFMLQSVAWRFFFFLGGGHFKKTQLCYFHCHPEQKLQPFFFQLSKKVPFYRKYLGPFGSLFPSGHSDAETWQHFEISLQRDDVGST